MSSLAFFGPPQQGASTGGAMITVHLVPVFEGGLVVFDLRSSDKQARWLPWRVLDFGGNPYECASNLGDDWCEGAVSDLSLADVMSFEIPGSGWELAIIFRAELTAKPRPRGARVPALLAAGSLDAIGRFDPVDLERWVAAVRAGAEAGREGGSRPPGPQLLF